MTYIFIRHDEKEYANGNGVPALDSPLIQDEMDYFKEIHLDNVDKVITSPFLRCRQTADKYCIGVPHEINLGFSEYLGHWCNFGPQDFDPVTWEYIKDFKFERSVNSLRSRINKSLKALPPLNPSEKVVIVTHGLCLDLIYQMLSTKTNEIFLFNSCPKKGFLVIKGNDVLRTL